MDDSGAVRYENHPTKVNMKFEAPKTQVMGIIINGLLNNNLNWTLILIGAGIAVTMELCGVSSLAFAVGVYIPMEYSTPIFLGGLVRWAVDAWTMRAIAELHPKPPRQRSGRGRKWKPLPRRKPVPAYCCHPA